MSRSARLESGSSVVRLDAPVGATLERIDVAVGDRVRRGTIVATLDARHLRDELSAVVSQIDAKRAELASIDKQRVAEAQLTQREPLLHRGELAFLEARLAGQRQAVVFARKEAERLRELAELGLYSELDRLRNEAALREREATVEVTVREIERQRADQATRTSVGSARRERLEREAETVAGELAALDKVAESLRNEIEERSLRSPVDGTVGRRIERVAGAWAEQGVPIVEIVPDTAAHVVAYFDPAAVGRVRPGQVARIRLPGRDPLSSRTLTARVERVATETDERGARVELAVDDLERSELGHGVAVRAEVVVERLSPLRWAAGAVAEAFVEP